MLLHGFVVGDRSHDKTNEIYELLAELGNKMKRLGCIELTTAVCLEMLLKKREKMVGTQSERNWPLF